MNMFTQGPNRRLRPLLVLSGIIALGTGALVGAATTDAKAGYTCVENATQTGNLVTIGIIATSGGPSNFCLTSKNVGTPNVPFAIFGDVVSSQVGATTDLVTGGAFAVPQGAGIIFKAACTHLTTLSGVCTGQASGGIAGVQSVLCSATNTAQSTLPDPALPGVPVVITTVCNVRWN